MRKYQLAMVAVLTGLAGPLANAEEAVLEEITVTAQKREQTLAEVPIAVSVLSGDSLARQNVSSIAELQGLVPNVHIAKTPFAPTINIRGVGSGGGDRTFEQSASMYVDGVYAGRANQFLNPFFDVERIEVVRGPQGVLFGVNSVAGGISITNKSPGDKLAGFLSTGYETYNQSYHVDGAVDIPLSNDGSLRLAGTKGQDGPYLKNEVAGGPEFKTDYDLLRGVVKWKATDDLTVKLSAETSRKKIRGSAFQMYALGTNTLPVYGYTIDTSVEDGILDFKRSSASPDEHTNIKANGFSLNLSLALGGQTLTSITGYSKFDYDQAVPAASIPINLGAALAEETFNQFYEELRLASPGNQRIEYVAGVTYFKQNDNVYQGIDLGVPGGLVGLRYGLQGSTRSYAAFGQVTFNFTKGLRAVAGLRYSDVKKDGNYRLSASDFGAPLNGYAFSPAAAVAIKSFPPLEWLTFIDPLNPAPQVTDHSLTLNKLDPSISLQADVNDNVHPYLTYSMATKAGGFDDQNKSSALADFTYKPESARSYELGVKLNYARLQINGDVFYTKYKDLQVTLPTGNNVVARNAASITSKGVELDALYQATEHVRVGGDVTYLDAKYDDFPGVGCIVPLDVLAAIFTPCAIEGVPPAQTNAKGKRVTLAPRMTATLRIDAMYPVTSALNLSWGGRAYYNDGYNMDPNQDPIDVQGSYTMYDAYIGLGGGGQQRWNVQVMGKNLSNKAVLVFGGYAGLGAGHQGIVNPGREIFLNANWNF